MFGSTWFITLVGWGVTKWLVEPRFSRADIAAQIAHANLPGLDGAARPARTNHERLTANEVRGLWWALLVALLGCAGVAWLILHHGAPLNGTYAKPPSGTRVPIWPDVIVPLLFVLFLLPGIAYGIAMRTIRNDRDVAKMMGEAMSSMGMYIVMAFFAAQFIEWFRESNLSLIIAVKGADAIASLNMPKSLTLAAMILMVATLNLLIASASAKWGLLAAVLVPMFMRLGFSPELTQAAYRVGDSATNPIAPLNPYVVVILVFMQKYLPKVGLGTLMALMLPYSIVLLIAWIVFLLAWIALDVPLGPGGAPLFM
jgi:aminobenzoyl-glutamate transport protein